MLPNTEINKSYYSSCYGLEIYQPNRFFYLQPILRFEYEYSKWEKRRDAIVLKLKERKRIKNMLLKYTSFVLFLIVSIVMLGFMLYVSPTELMAIVIGVTMPIFFIASYHFADALFETETYFIKIKRRGKVYL